MKEAQALEIVENYEQWEDVSCSCHINPPCSKCVEQPMKEDYDKAISYLQDNESLS